MRKSMYIMIAAMALAGSGIPVSKILVTDMPVFTANWVSLLFALPVLIIPGLRQLKGLQLQKLQGNSIHPLVFPALQGLFGMALFRVFMFYGLKRLPAVECGLLTASAPGIMALMAFIMLKEKPGPARILGIVLTAAGILLIQLRGGSVRFTVIGSVFILAAIVCECLLTIIRKSARVYIPPAANTLLIVVFCLIYLLPAVLFENGMQRLFPLSIKQIAGCAYMGVMVTAMAYICWGYSSTKMPAGVTGIITGMMPLTGTVLSVALIGEAFHPRYILGGLCIFTSFLLCTGKGKITSFGRSSCPGPSESACVNAETGE